MTYGISVYGVSSYSSNINVIPNFSQLYLGCEINDGFEANAIFDELIVYVEDKTDSQIEEIFNRTSPTEWTDTTIFNANFNNAMQGGNLFADEINVKTWHIYKKRISDIDYTLLHSIPNNDNGGITEIEDFEITNYVDYEYLLEGEAEDNTVTSKFQSNGNKINFEGIYLIDKEQGLQFHFRYNIPEITFIKKSDRSLTETFSRFPVVRRNVVNYKMGSLQCDAIQISSSNDEVMKHIRLLESFEGSQDLILKVDNGDIFKVDIYNISYTRHPETNEITTIKCDYTQIGEVI